LLCLARYRFQLIAETSLALPPFYGQTLRGGLATVMRRAVCVTHQPVCDGCLLRRQCAYGVIFEPIPPSSSPDPRYAATPRPYVLGVTFDPQSQGPMQRQPGEPLEFELTLMGSAVHQLPYFVYTVLELGERGLGHGRGRFHLGRVVALSPQGPAQEIFNGQTLRGPPSPLTAEDIVHSSALPEAERITVCFQTPLRIDLDGDLVFPITFHALMRALVNRITTLERFYGSFEDADPTQYGGLLDAAREVKTVKDAQRWVDLERYSTRQKTRLKMGGAVGEVVYECEDFSPFAELLALGEWLHVGKLTTMGLGKFEVIR